MDRPRRYSSQGPRRSVSPTYCSTCWASDARTLGRESDSDDTDHRGRPDINSPPRSPINRGREPGPPAVRARPPNHRDAEAEHQLPPEAARPWGPDDNLGVFPWNYITGESRAWIYYVEDSYGSNFRWCRARGLAHDDHGTAMCASSPFKKGIFYDSAAPPLRPTYISHTPPFTVVVAGDPEWFVLPFFCSSGRSFSEYIEPYTTFDPRCMISRRRKNENTRQLSLRTHNASIASMIYLCGQVRLGDTQCHRCRHRRITTNMPGEAIPVCVTAGRYYHGVCANCQAMGGTLSEMLVRCTVSRPLSFQEYDQLSRGLGDPGWLGRSPFIGDNATDLAFARNLLWRKALPRVSRNNRRSATVSSQNRMAGGSGNDAIASSSNTAEVGGPMAAPRRPSGAMDGSRGTATASSSAMAAVRGRNTRTPANRITRAATSESRAMARTPGTAVARRQTLG